MRRNLDPYARGKAQAWSWLSLADQADEPRRLPRSIALLVAVVLLAWVTSASAIQFERKWGGYGSGDGQFSSPVWVATDAAGNVYVSDAGNDRIQKFSSSGVFISKWGSSGSGDGQFRAPQGIATDSAGNVYVADRDNNRIQKFSSSGVFITQWGSSGFGDGQFNKPQGIATDSAGNVYVTDLFHHRIQKFSSSGVFITKWGSSGSGNGQFSYPHGIATDSASNVYVADQGNHRIQKFSSSGVFITKWGSSGSGNGQFSPPWGVATDSADNVYVADSNNFRIQKFSSSGAFLTKWGSYGSGEGQFQYPTGVATDSAGNVYVSDVQNHSIAKFGNVTQTTIDSGPAGLTNDPTPTFSFHSSPTGASFQCRFDSDPFEACSGPDAHTPASALADGSHTFYVRATSTAFGPDPTPASRTFTVDTVPPNTTISGGPSAATNDPTPIFTFFSSQAGSSLRCKLDSGSYAACGSPKTTAHLTDGSHTFYVRATDPAGNVDPTPASRMFTVRTAAVSVSGTILVVTAATGAKDNLQISRPSASVLRVTDLPSGAYTGSGVHTGAGCTRVGDYTANCTGEIARIQVNSGDQADQVVNSTVVQSTLIGGPANDVLTGGSRNDSLTGGGGADVMKGMNGNDQLFGRDLTDDTTINCDGAIGTPGSADKADLDLLPKDSPVSGCETVTRH